MSEQTQRMPPHQEALFAPLSRQDLPSFVVLLPDLRVVAATPACAAFGVETGAEAPLSVKIVAKRVAMSLRRAPRLERVRLPGTQTPLPFACIGIHSPAGHVVLFADPLALAEGGRATRALPPRSGLPAVIPQYGRDADGRCLRFSWQMDAAGRLMRISPELPEALGSAEGDWVGRDFQELEDVGLIADAGPMRAALRTGGSFFGLTLRTGGHPARRIEFGGVPLFDQARQRRGTRGFGLLWGAEPQDEAPAGSDSEAQHFNVVPLHGGSLTPRERSAFHEIARTLSEAIEEWPKAATEARPELDETEPLREPDAGTASGAQAEGEDHLLDRLPIGIVVQQGGKTVRTNKTLLGWLGVRDTAEFVATGGLSPRLVRDSRHGGLDLETLHGDRLPVEVRLVASPWSGRPALVHVIRPIEGAPAAAAASPESPRGPASGVQMRVERAAARRQALDFIPYPVLLLDRDGTVEMANTAAADACGFTADDLEGEPFTILLAPGCHVQAVAMLDAAAAGKGQQNAPLTLRHRLGTEEQAEAMLVTTGDPAARFCLVLQTRTEAVVEAPSAVPVPAQPQPQPLAPLPPAGVPDDPRRVDAIVRRVSHDLRDPLTVLLGFVDSVRSNLYGPVGSRRYQQQAEAAAAAGQALVDTLDDLGALALPPEPVTPVSLSPLVTDALAHLSDAARRRGVLLRTALSEDVTARANPEGFARLARELLTEAMEATPHGGQVIVTLTADDAAPNALLQVRDGGAALSEEEIAIALDPTRAATVSTRFSRAGRPFRLARLGALARGMGGDLALTRGLDTGLLVQVSLPRA